MPDLTLQWPSAGLVKRFAMQSQPPFSTPDCLNVVVHDPFDQRARGGQRPGLAKAYNQQLGSAGNREIRLIYDIRKSDGTTLLVACGDNNDMHRDVAGTLTAVATQTNTVAKNDILVAAEYLGDLYIAYGSDANKTLLKYTVATDTLANHSASAGTLPDNCKHVNVFLDRLVLSHDTDNRQLIHMSKQGAPADWNTSDTTVQGAVTLDSDNVAGQIGEPVIATITHTFDCLLIGCETSWYRLAGNPKAGGRVMRLSDTVGLLDRQSWCHFWYQQRDMWLCFASDDGIGFIAPGCGSPPISVSRELLPKELVDIDPSANTVTMMWDRQNRVIRLANTVNATGALTGHFAIDPWDAIRGGRVSFWPEKYAEASGNHESFFNYQKRDPQSRLAVCGCRDGYIRRWDNSVDNDDGTAIESYIFYGPLYLSRNPFQAGRLRRLALSLDDGSGAVDVELYLGDSAQEAYNSAALATHSFVTKGRGADRAIEGRGVNAFLKIKNGANARWSLEAVAVAIEQASGKLVATG